MLTKLLYAGLLLLQPLWHGLLPPPMGARIWWLAVLTPLPLLLPLRGIFAGRLRAMTWGGYIAVLYFIVGVMEAWSHPAQRLPAMVQIALSTGYIILLWRSSHSR